MRYAETWAMRHGAFVFVLLNAISLTPAQAADEVQYGASPAWVKAVETPRDDGTMAEAPAKVMLRNHQMRFGQSTTEWYVESFVRIQKAQGLQALNSIVLPWKPDTDILTVHKCQLLRGNGVIDLLAGERKFEIVRREDNLEYAALDGMLSAMLQPEGGEVGDVLNLAFSIRRESGLIKGPELVLGDLAAGLNDRIEVRATWDKSVPIRWRASQDAKGAREVRVGDNVEVSWVGEKLEPLDQADNVPSRFWRAPEIEFTSYKSWNEVSRTLAPLYAEAAGLTADSPLTAEARAIAASSTDPVVRLEAALKLVQEKVRYVYLGMGEGNLKPAAADVTWQRRFGDCKGKTSLLIAMLRELGIQAEPVAVATVGGDRISGVLPAIGAFNHVIVRAHASGRTWWLDGTGSGSWRRADLVVPNYHWGLPVTARGEPLLRMNAAAADEPVAITSTHIDAREGIHTDAPFSAELKLRSAQAAALNAQLSQISQANREQSLRNYWTQQYDFVEIKTVSSEFEESSGVLTLRMEGTANMDWGGNKYTTDGMRVGLNYDFTRKKTINADAPFSIEHPVYRITRQRIELPAVGTFSLKGANYDATIAGIHHKRQARLEGREFTGEVLYRTLASEVTADEARAAEKQLQAMWKDRLNIESSGYKVTDADVAALRTRKFTRTANLIWRGNILMNRKDYDAALADFDAAVKADEKSASALAHRGLVKFWKYDLPAAQTDFEAALALDSRSAVALRGLGGLLRLNGDYKSSVEKLSASLQIDDKDAFALTQRAYSYAMLDDQTAALADAEAVIKLSPASVDMYDLRASILTARDQKAEASAVLEAMLAANPEDSSAWLVAARNYSLMGERDKAMMLMDRAISVSPTAKNYMQRFSIRDSGDFAGLTSDLNAALGKDPDYGPALYQRADLASRRGEHAAAIKLYGEMLKDEKNAENKRLNHRLRGIEYARSGDRISADRDFNASLSDKPTATHYNNFCWDVAIADVALERALAACDKALELQPGNSAYLDSRGMALLQLGRFDEAIAAYDAALSTRPKQPSSLYGRGIAKNLRCTCADGEADLRAATRIDPTVVRTFTRAGLAP